MKRPIIMEIMIIMVHVHQLEEEAQEVDEEADHHGDHQGEADKPGQLLMVIVW